MAGWLVLIFQEGESVPEGGARSTPHMFSAAKVFYMFRLRDE
jgi:hypothetical protein